jgi:hypothetical protein
LIAVAALVAVMAASALTMTQQAYANPCSRTENGEDKDVSDEGARGANTEGNIACSFEDDVITFGPDQAPAGITESAGATEQASTTGPTGTTSVACFDEEAYPFDGEFESFDFEEFIGSGEEC